MTSQNQMVGGCCVCLDERGWKENPLVYCDGSECNVAVHKNCYGITKVPSGPWYCQKCASKETGDHVRCCLCPKLKGVLKKTEDDRWAHVLCALYVPEIKFGNVTTMEPIIVGNIPANSFNTKTCYICEENKDPDRQWGVCLLCAKPSCKVVFHVSCGQSRGLLVEEQGAALNSVDYRGYCPAHTKKNKSTKNSPTHGPAKNESGSGTEEKKNFATPLTVEVAEKPKSRSRAKPQTNAGGAPKPKRVRKPATKKNAAALAKLSPQMKSPLRSPLRSPNIRSPTLLSPGRSPISLVPTTSAHGLLEQQFELGKRMLENQAPLDIAQLLNCISKIQQENETMEAELQQLTTRRDNLVSVNARLALPITISSTTAPSNNALPSMLTNGPTSFPLGSVPSSIQHVPRSLQPPARSSNIATQLAPLASMTNTNAQKESTSNKKGTVVSSSREPATSQSRKRQSESVIKMNTKQAKPNSSTPPTVSKQTAKGSNSQLKSSPADFSHFQWPAPVARSSSVNSSSSSPALDSNYAQPATSRLPPIDALSQSRVPSQQMSATSAYLNSAATLNSYTVGSTAAAALAANYTPYPQFPMFPMSGLPDMGNLNPAALTGLAMQGLHNSQQYYRAAADATVQNSKSN